MFSTTGLVGHIQAIASSGKSHWLVALATAMFAGLSAAAFVFAFIRDRRLVLPVILFQIAGFLLQAKGLGAGLLRPLSAGEATTLVAVYGAACTLTLMLGYIFFIDFIVREGVKHMGLRTEMALAERTHRLTDGLTEVENDAGEDLGVDGVERLIGQDLDRPLQEVHESVMAAVGRHGPQVDDQTLLLIRVL